MSALIDSKYDQFYFDAHITEPLALKKRELRSELEYDADVFSEKTALKYISKFSKCFEGNIYLLTTSQNIKASSKLRTKKGVLWQKKELRNLENKNWEVDVSYGKTRLVSLVNLDGFNYDTSEEVVLNWMFSLIILSTMDISFLYEYIKEWLAKGDNCASVYNYDAVAHNLNSLDSTAVLRYFPADNNGCEMLVVVGKRDFIGTSIEDCINSIA